MKRVGFRVGTACSKNKLTGVGRVAKNTIENLLEINNEDYEYMLLEKDRIGVTISSDLAAASVFPERMVSLQCMSERVDIIHSFYEPCTNFRSETKKILTVHDLARAKYPQWISNDRTVCEQWKQTLGNAIYRADIIVAVSEYTKKDIIETYNVNDNKVRVIYNGLDGSLSESIYQGDITGSKFHLSSRYILSVCTIEPRKNLCGVLEAFRNYKERYRDDDIKLVIVGKEGWMTEAVFDSIKESPYIKDIVVTGYVTDGELLSLYKNCLFTIYASYFEGFGLPILESMTFGKTVVASNTSSMPEVGGDAVEYCNPYDVESITTAIETLSQNTERRKALEGKAKHQAERFSYKQAALDILHIYEELS